MMHFNLLKITIILVLIFNLVSSKICIKTFEETRSNINNIEHKMNDWLSYYSDIKIIDLGIYRSDDDYDWHHGGYISYHCESIN